jgi:hypothetical protein
VQRVRLEPAGQTPAMRPRAPAPAGDVLLDLQRAVGNRAVGRILARKTKAPSRQTGLRADAIVRDYVAKAVAFRARNADASLVQYALFLGAAANVELAKLGVPDVRMVMAKGDIGAAAQFWADGWYMLVNPRVFTSRPEQVKTLGDLTDQEAALIADHVFHEARHAEQTFRVARLQAAEGKDPGLGVEEDIADAAAASPLALGPGNAKAVNEAREWRENLYGADATFREVATEWHKEVADAGRAAKGVSDDTAGDVRDRLVRQLAAWVKPGHGMDMIRSHLASARARKRTQMVAVITRIEAEYANAEAAVQKLPGHPQASDFPLVYQAFVLLSQAAASAYYNQSVEDDAYGAGNAVVDAFPGAGW